MKLVIVSVTFLHREKAIVSVMLFHFFLKLSIGLLYPNVETYNTNTVPQAKIKKYLLPNWDIAGWTFLGNSLK